MHVDLKDSRLELRLAVDDDDRQAAYRLRYLVFAEELGADGPGVDHASRSETDEFDRWCDHLLLVDRTIPAASLDHVVGAYRFLRGDIASSAGIGFYSGSEFDLSVLIATGLRMLELGRSCLHPDYRGGSGMYLLWNGLADYVLTNRIQILFGVASFHGNDLHPIRQPLSYLHHNHLAPRDLRASTLDPNGWEDMLLPREEVDQQEAMARMPSLIKAYLRLGGFVGHGAYVDRTFNTVDVCVLMDTERMCQRRRVSFERKWNRES